MSSDCGIVQRLLFFVDPHANLRVSRSFSGEEMPQGGCAFRTLAFENGTRGQIDRRTAERYLEDAASVAGVNNPAGACERRRQIDFVDVLEPGRKDAHGGNSAFARKHGSGRCLTRAVAVADAETEGRGRGGTIFKPGPCSSTDIAARLRCAQQWPGCLAPEICAPLLQCAARRASAGMTLFDRPIASGYPAASACHRLTLLDTRRASPSFLELGKSWLPSPPSQYCERAPVLYEVPYASVLSEEAIQ